VSNLAIAVPTMNPTLLKGCLWKAWGSAFTAIDTFVWLNGIQTEVNELLLGEENMFCGDFWVGGSEKNIGVTPALHQLYEMANQADLAENDFLLFLHDDTLIFEKDWDVKVLDWLSERPEAVLFGFGGAKGLGDPDLYQKPYQLQQLARRDFISNMKNADLHGRRVTVPTRVATLDLFSVGARMSFLRDLKGWSWWPHVHHGLDNAICLEAKRRGGEVWMLPIACDHLGGQTSTKVNFQSTFGEAEGKIHSDGHVTLYEGYRDILPVMEA